MRPVSDFTERCIKRGQARRAKKSLVLDILHTNHVCGDTSPEFVLVEVVNSRDPYIMRVQTKHASNNRSRWQVLRSCSSVIVHL